MNFLKPAKHIKPLPENQIDDTYKRLRLQVFLGIFIGYAGYYLLRKNFSLAMPALQEQGFTKAELGFALSAVSIAYGFSKFFMGTVSDRSNARIFFSSWISTHCYRQFVNGICTVLYIRYRYYVCPIILKWMVSRYGLATFRPCSRSLV